MSIVAVARSELPLRNLKIKYGEERVVTVQGDLSEPSVVKRVVEVCLSKYGRIDSIIANAGVLEPVQKLELADVGQWRQLFDVNFFSVVSLVAHAIPHLKKTKGNVILVSSGASTKGYVSCHSIVSLLRIANEKQYGWGAYGASKAALNQFSAQLAAEEPEISTVAVAPGVVDTQMQVDIRDKCKFLSINLFLILTWSVGKNMSPESHKRFTDLKRNQELLDPLVPATIYANLALKGVKKEINGMYLRYDDPLLEEYSS